MFPSLLRALVWKQVILPNENVAMLLLKFRYFSNVTSSWHYHNSGPSYTIPDSLFTTLTYLQGRRYWGGGGGGDGVTCKIFYLNCWSLVGLRCQLSSIVLKRAKNVLRVFWLARIFHLVKNHLFISIQFFHYHESDGVRPLKIVNDFATSLHVNMYRSGVMSDYKISPFNSFRFVISQF
jgi:hypothetical protein